MLSSTSNSESTNGKTTAHAIGLLIAMVGALLSIEVVLSTNINKLSQNQLHVNSQMPDTFRRLRLAEERGDSTILFLGNSHTRRSVDPQLIEARLANEFSPSPCVAAVYPDATGLIQWYFIVRHMIFREGVKPRLLCIGFRNKHLWNLEFDWDAFAHGLIDREDWTEAFDLLHPDADRYLRFRAANLLTCVAMQKTMKKYLLSVLVPGFEDMAGWMRGTEQEFPIPDRAPQLLAPLVQLCKNEGIDLVFWRVPTMGPLEDQEPRIAKIREIIEQQGATYFEPLPDTPLGPEMFRDDMSHANEDGQLLTSTALSEFLKDYLRHNDSLFRDGDH